MSDTSLPKAEPPEGEATTIPGDVAPLSTTESRGITTAISLLGSALQMHDPDDVRRNIVLARSARFDVLTSIDSSSDVTGSSPSSSEVGEGLP